MKNGRSDGFGVEPTDKLSISGPESSPSQHDNESNSWNNASNSRSPRNAPAPRGPPPSSSSGTLNRFNNAMIFCLKFLCCIFEMEETKEKKKNKFKLQSISTNECRKAKETKKCLRD